MLEGNLLYPIRYIANLVCGCTWRIIKLLLAVWLQHPTSRGALSLEQVGGKFLDLGFEKVYPALGKVMMIMGFPDRSGEKKTE